MGGFVNDTERCSCGMAMMDGRCPRCEEQPHVFAAPQDPLPHCGQGEARLVRCRSCERVVCPEPDCPNLSRCACD